MDETNTVWQTGLGYYLVTSDGPVNGPIRYRSWIYCGKFYAAVAQLMKSINVNMVLKTQTEKSDVLIETFGYFLHLWEIFKAKRAKKN